MTRGLKRFCADCPPGSKRPAPHPGPRCFTHHKAVLRARREAAHGRSIMHRYGLTKEQYSTLYKAQGGRCYICQRATGARKKLAVDHDHATGYVRGLCCGPCNSMLAHARDNAEVFDRAAQYLRTPPAFDVIGKVKPDGSD